ncbi:surfeit locus protein 6-domain-containing protein [Paraphoma chrysanthemicola]|uniref:Surfeit locus protein 6-domain-containing protein n=1 Tax=Paraphoma chrysanthemicola TaxID=798071 RepID=A0A8K0RC06_9PLEO|nr:surfeit locus protein 6-domain-containing protein [Paraphoma chrysanthemicola]
MSLIPAKDYYGKDESITSTQWLKTKKQSLEERQAAKRAKLDPASHKSAKDVMDENARKRKRELEGDVSEAESSDLDMDIEKEKPLEGIKKAKKQKTKTTEPEEETEVATETPQLTKAEKQALAKSEKRKEKRKDKQAKKKQKEDTKKAQGAEFSKGLTKAAESDDEADENDGDDDDLENAEERIQDLDVSGLIEEGQSTAPSTAANSNSSTASVVSAASSSSSVPPAGETPSEKKQKKPLQIDEESRKLFQARLTAKLEAMRASRKADGPDGRPARNRAELIEARRKKEAERKLAKKASRQELKEDEARQKAEEQLARIRGGSGSPSIFPPRSPENERSFNFGRVAWQDGQQLESSLSRFQESKKRKGKSDAKTALDAATKKQARINGLDETKRKDIEEKDLWLAAKKRAQGEKVFDDVNLLKKTLKRQEKQKSKSKQEWKERLTNVQDGKEKRQKKREENLKKRREEKGQKGKKKVKKPGKKVKRPGFEGTFKAR